MKSSQTLKERKEMMTALALIAPTIIVMVIFLYIPFVNALQTSFYKYNGLGALEHFVGLKNYAKVLADPKFVRSLWNTFYLIMVSFLAIPIGFVFAYILYVGVPGKKIFNAGLFIPYLISMVVVGCIWRIIYDPTIGPEWPRRTCLREPYLRSRDIIIPLRVWFRNCGNSRMLEMWLRSIC